MEKNYIGWIQHVFHTRKMGTRSTSRKARFLLQLLAWNKNSGLEAELAGAACRIAFCNMRVTAPRVLLIPGDSQEGNGATSTATAGVSSSEQTSRMA